MSQKTLVVYLFTKFDVNSSILNFLKYYLKYKSGVKHKLLVCFKLLDKQKIISLRLLLKNINYIEFIDTSKVNDYDFGSYKRIAKAYSEYKILFLNSHSQPTTNLWLKKLLKHFTHKTIIGTSASRESLLNSIKLKKFYKIFSYILRKKKLKKNFLPFPNPHIRTANLLIKGSDFLEYIKNKKIISKEDAWMIESGVNSLTNYFKKKKFNLLIVNSDGNKFTENNWMYSETYHYKSQSKSIISDKHSRKYLTYNKEQKRKSQKSVWGT